MYLTSTIIFNLNKKKPNTVITVTQNTCMVYTYDGYKPISIWTSNLPGRNRASSIMSFLFVIP